jgi:hypothetical protein
MMQLNLRPVPKEEEKTPKSPELQKEEEESEPDDSVEVKFSRTVEIDNSNDIFGSSTSPPADSMEKEEDLHQKLKQRVKQHLRAQVLHQLTGVEDPAIHDRDSLTDFLMFFERDNMGTQLLHSIREEIRLELRTHLHEQQQIQKKKESQVIWTASKPSASSPRTPRAGANHSPTLSPLATSFSAASTASPRAYLARDRANLVIESPNFTTHLGSDSFDPTLIYHVDNIQLSESYLDIPYYQEFFYKRGSFFFFFFFSS